MYMESKSKTLIIGDMHFGIKTNSTLWLAQMLDYLDNQITSSIDEDKPNNVVFLGDLFDVRYSTNCQVGCAVKRHITKLVDNHKQTQFIFLAGNHDYFSPLEKFSQDNVYNLIFGEEYSTIHKNVIFVTEDYFVYDNMLIMPWYCTENSERFFSILEDNNDVNVICCHDDLSKWDNKRILATTGIRVYAGHIHYPWTDGFNNLYNIGAALPLTFNDVNDKRYYILIDNETGKTIKKYHNITTPMFKRWFNEEIFALTSEDFENSYIEFHISKELVNKARYVEQIKLLKGIATEHALSSRVVVTDTSEDDKETLVDFNTNITKYIDDNIPNNLIDKYNKVKERVTNENK